MKKISEIELDGTFGKKVISFEKDGKRNINQFDYFNAIFNPDLSIKTDFNEFSWFGGFRCAKSFSQQTAVHLIATKYPKLKAVFIRDTYGQLEASVIQQFNTDFETSGNYKYAITKRIANYNNGSFVSFKTFEVDTDILSAEYDLIAVCQVEDISEDLFLQLIGRLSGRVLPKPLLLVEGNPSAGWVKNRYKDVPAVELAKKGIFAITNGKTSDNPFITEEYIIRVRNNSPAWWAARYLDSEWNNIDEMVFSEFREAKHIIDPVDTKYLGNMVKRGGFDYAWRTPSAINWAFVNYDGDITIYDEWDATQQTPTDISKVATRHNKDDEKILFVADYSIKAPDRDGRNTWDELTGLGMDLTECSKDEFNNILLVNSMLKQDRLFITRNCVNTIKEISNWKWKKVRLGNDKGIPDEVVDKDNHHCDCVNYIVSNLEGEKSKKRDRYKNERTAKYPYNSSTC
jgi:hypothetical protein